MYAGYDNVLPIHDIFQHLTTSEFGGLTAAALNWVICAPHR